MLHMPFKNLEPYLILTRTMQEQQREITLLLLNPLVKPELTAELRAKNSNQSANFVSQLMEMDHLLNTINMSLVSARIDEIDIGTEEVEFNFNNLGLTRIPRELVKQLMLYNPITLDLERNYLSALPESIGNLSSLNTLNIKSNQIRFLPASLGKLTNLHTLNVSNNHLSTLPSPLAQLELLTHLYLDDNNFTTFAFDLSTLLMATQDTQYLDRFPLQTLIATARLSYTSNFKYPEDHYSAINRILSDYIMVLRNNQVRIIRNNCDPYYLMLSKIICQQRKNIAQFLKSWLITTEQRALLEAARAVHVQETLTIEQLIATDQLLKQVTATIKDNPLSRVPATLTYAFNQLRICIPAVEEVAVDELILCQTPQPPTP